MHKVFLSYGYVESHGHKFVANTQQQLQAVGFEVSSDVTESKGGDTWYRKLKLELGSSDIVVIIVTDKMRKTKWVANEVSMAENMGIPMIPVVAETVKISPWLRHLYRETLDFSQYANWQQLVETINSQLALDK